MDELDRLAINDVEDIWDIYVASSPNIHRWTFPAGSPHPIRQKNLSRRTLMQIPERVFRHGLRGPWCLDRNGEVREIITIEQFANKFISAWLISPITSQQSFTVSFAKEYEGVRHRDAEFVIAQYNAIITEHDTNAQASDTPLPVIPTTILSPGTSTNGSDDSDHDSNYLFGRAYQQQIDLFDDPRRHKLLDTYREIRELEEAELGRQDGKGIATHLSRLGGLAQHIFHHGKPARPWMMGDPLHTMNKLDYILLTEFGHCQLSEFGEIAIPVVVRNPIGFSRHRTAMTRDSFFEKLAQRPQGTRIQSQDLSKGIDELPIKEMSIPDLLKSWRETPDTFSQQHPPLNLLDVTDKTQGVWLEGLSKHYQLLSDACSFSSDGMLFRLRQLESGSTGQIGKDPIQLWAASDLSNCIQFRIIAQRGAISGWHMDNAGVWTWVTLEGNSNDPGEADDDVVKYWPVYPLHTMGDAEQTSALAEFGAEGADWRPTPVDGIPIISLTRGDTLIMPPGTIHAPISLTDCMFVGGMCMHPRHVVRTINAWNWANRNPMCTNEAPPKQTRSIIDYIQGRAHAAPTEHGIQVEDLPELDEICDEISGSSLHCNCKDSCKRDCRCQSVGQRCGPYCHQGKKCKNHWGCQVSFDEGKNWPEPMM